MFFSKAARRYEQALVDWCKLGTSRVCEALSYALPHDFRLLLIEEANKQNGVAGEKFRVLPRPLYQMSPESFDIGIDKHHLSSPVVADLPWLQEQQKKEF